jgi:peptide/nickel transport system permease protein
MTYTASDPALEFPTTSVGVRSAGTWRLIAQRVRHDRVALCAFSFLIAVVLIVAAAPIVAPHDPSAQDLLHRYASYSSAHRLGTDKFGRDVLSRLIYGGRTTLFAASQGVVIATALGVPLGLAAGYHGGWLDAVTSRVSDALMGIPALIAALTIVAILGNSLTNAMIAVGIAIAPRFFRITRANARDVCGEYYVEASRSIGTPARRIIVKHVLPNVVSSLVVQISLTFGFVILAEASLAYIGIGVQLPTASWGSMLLSASQGMSSRPWDIVPPGIAIVLCVMAFSMFGDAISDASAVAGPRETL